MLDVNDYERYESPELIEWKKLSSVKQREIIVELTKSYSDKVIVEKVNNQSIEVTLFMIKSEVYDFLVKYEYYIRKNTGNFPVIILLKDRTDENRTRK